MINSVNTLEFLKPKLISMDKFNATSATRIHHQTSRTPPRTYLTFVTNSSESIKPPLMAAMAGVQSQQLHHHQQQQQQQPPLRQERVRVQHLENHTKLQNNNCWNNFRTLLSASSCGDGGGSCKEMQEEKEFVLEVDDIQHTIDIQNKSAFNLEFNKRNIYSNSNNNNNNNNNYKKRNDDSKSLLPPIEPNNNHYYFKHHQQQNGFINKQPPQQKTMMVLLPRRTEDQEHAYRRIESVHNYAKLKSYDDDDATDDQSPNGSRHSSYLDDEEDEDDEDDEDDDDDDEEDDDNNDADYDAEEDEMIDLDADYEDIFNRRRFPKLSTSSADGGIISARPAVKKSQNCMASQKIQSARQNYEDADLHVDVDVETVENQTTTNTVLVMHNGANESAVAKPDHHARRPMNAFLIFCKRHRAIVKERYKTLENRAITKILGDWWASLDINDKTCFTSLAQQNKDAFFSANPNFKWYKLPAPPLRTLNTRPTNCNNTGGGGGGGVVGCIASAAAAECDDSSFVTAVAESISNNTRSNTNYFKLADEAQMGDLSQLMQDKSKTKQCALQQALGETSQFMRSHITGSVESAEEKQQQQLKRRFYNENSFSSNSSEEDGLVPKKKRACKGKIYQELINSGQIAAPAVKKSKSSQRLAVELNPNQCLEIIDMENKLGHREESGQLDNANNIAGAMAQKGCAPAESDNLFSYDLTSFDLEEKIKELPALSLDDYLQRKRNTKKKKKFTTNGKKRGNRSNISGNSNCNVSQSNTAISSATSQPPMSPPTSDHVLDAARIVQQRKQQQQQAVGSQKRKARKESITRRDVSAIEQEVASLLPLTINGCCYFQEASLPLSPVITSYKNVAIEKDTNSPTTTTVESFKQTSPIIPLTTTIMAPSTTSSPRPQPQPPITPTVELMNNNTLNDNIISSTSDLLILAEVAANHTELKH